MTDENSGGEYDYTVVGEQVPDYTEETDLPLIEDNSSEFDGIRVNDSNFSDLAANELYLDIVDLLQAEGLTDFDVSIDVAYMSKEYMEELAFNSQENIYYGYKLSELDDAFQGTRYVFTCDGDGSTAVKAFENYDDTYERALRNVAIGIGVIVICVTVTLATGGFGAPFVAGSVISAVNIIFSSAATSAATSAIFGGTISSVVAGATVGFTTNDLEQTKKAVALAGSEGFMWGAVIGAGTGMISGAVQYGKILKAIKELPKTELVEILKYTPVNGENGAWTGVRGNSTYVPKDVEIQKLLAEKGLTGIKYTNGVPDFSPLAFDKVQITGKYLDALSKPSSSQVRQAMQKEAKEILAKQRGVTPAEISEWMKANTITIHEDIDMTNLLFVRTEINGTFKHLGGVSEYMTRLAQVIR
jgi:hypothetical protein